MITASGRQEKVRAIEAGADDFITKPLDQAELLARIRSLVRIKAYQDTVQAQTRELLEWNRTLEARVQQQVEQLERLDRLRRFLAPQVAELVISAGGEALLESHRREIAVVCAELRGFAALTETTEPEAVLEVLREFHATLGQVVFRHQGTLAHVSSSGLMVFFNDPLPCPNPAERSVRLAVALHTHIGQVKQSWHWRGYELGLGVGVALGYASVGKIGLEGRSEYGAVGPVTILATHLCNEAQSGQTLVADRVYGATRELVEAEPVGELRPKEFMRPVTAYDVRRLKEATASLEASVSALSPREREVAALVARGLTNHQVAEQLVVTEGTAAKHIENILGKLGFASRAQVAVWAVRQGLATGPD
jgi:class 3 adenylate cyclase